MQNKKGFVYLIRSGNYYKVGICICRWSKPSWYKTIFSEERLRNGVLSDLRNRLKVYLSHNPHDIELVEYDIFNDAESVEKRIYEQYGSRRIERDFINMGKKEKRVDDWMMLSDQDLREIIEIIQNYQ